MQGLQGAAVGVLRGGGEKAGANWQRGGRELTSGGAREPVVRAQENPKVVALLSETAKIAGSSMPIQYELRQSFQAASAIGAHLTTLDLATGNLTLINNYAVHPVRAEELLDFLARSTVETIRYVLGFISANLHVNSDRTQVVNYAQWMSSEATAAARKNPKVVALMRKQL